MESASEMGGKSHWARTEATSQGLSRTQSSSFLPAEQLGFLICRVGLETLPGRLRGGFKFWRNMPSVGMHAATLKGN